MEEKTTDMMTAPAATEDRVLTAMQELVARIDVTDPRLQHRYGETVLSALTQALYTAQTEKLLQDSCKMEAEFALPSDSLAAVRGLKLLLTKLFCGASAKEESLKKQYAESEKNVNLTKENLETQLLALTKELEKLEKLQEECEQLQQLLSVYHQAGRQRLRREKETTLSSKKEIAGRTGLARDAQNVREFEKQCSLFEARLHALEEKTLISEQILPQLNLLKEAKTDTARRLQEFLVGDVPMWQDTAGLTEGGVPGREERLREADKAFAAALEKLSKAAENSAQTVLSAGIMLENLTRQLQPDADTE